MQNVNVLMRNDWLRIVENEWIREIVSYIKKMSPLNRRLVMDGNTPWITFFLTGTMERGHRSDSNKGSDYITILFFFLGFQVLCDKDWKSETRIWRRIDISNWLNI